jgi:hypothetical protein
MKTFKLGLLTGACAIAACTAIGVAPQAAEAQAWNYGMDSSYDGTGAILGTNKHGVGPNSAYEAFGMAYTANDDTVTFAFNANFGILGRDHSRAADGNIGWGDLFLNLDPTKNFTDSRSAGSVIGIRFAGTNDSGLNETGLFTDFTTKKVASQNSGWTSYNKYNNYVNKKGGSVENIDGMTVSESQAYLGDHGQNVMNTGTKIGDVSTLDSSALASMGLDFGSQGGTGSETFGFSFARSLLPGGDLNWIAHVMAECTNDTVGMSGNFEATPPPGGPGGPGEPPVGTPEPSVMLGSAAALYGVWKGKRRAKKNKA